MALNNVLIIMFSYVFYKDIYWEIILYNRFTPYMWKNKCIAYIHIYVHTDISIDIHEDKCVQNLKLLDFLTLLHGVHMN
jgi:hypothetical protein